LPGRKRNRDFGRRKLQVNCRRGLVIAVHKRYLVGCRLIGCGKTRKRQMFAVACAN
jgi:hypothetical protein